MMIALAISLVLHGVGVHAWSVLRPATATPVGGSEPIFEVETRSTLPAPLLLSSSPNDSPHALLLTQSTKAAVKPERRKQVARVKLPSGQVVDVARGNDEKSERAEYLAEHDNRTDQEMRARETDAFYGRAMPRRTTDRAPDNQKQKTRIQGNQGTGTTERAQVEETHAPANETRALATQPEAAKRNTTQEQQAKDLAKPQPARVDALTDEGAQRRKPQATRELARVEAGNENIGPATPGDTAHTDGSSNPSQRVSGALAAADRQGSDGKAGTPDVLEHRGSALVHAAVSGAAPNDYLGRVPAGDRTSLNTREFKYALFFNRLKQKVGQAWHPHDAILRSEAAPSIWSRSMATVVDVALSDTGRVAKIVVVQSSGFDFLDDESLAAFRRAAPFESPPAELLDPSRQVRFHYTFHIDPHVSRR
jgi:TonB family protein